MIRDVEYQRWWEEKWKESERLLTSVFGETSPPNTVISFEWKDFSAMIPGGCALVFPPRPPSRPEWLTLSHGLTQPLSPDSGSYNTGPSAYGYEFGFLTNDRERWSVVALGQLLTYVKQSDARIGRGHCVPVWFREADGNVEPVLGKRAANSNESVASEMRAMLFWPYMRYPEGFSTSTGFFTLLIGTTITQEEWDMAKATSSAHLLLLLFRAGFGQASHVARSEIVHQSRWRAEWERIRVAKGDRVEQELFEIATRDGS